MDEVRRAYTNKIAHQYYKQLRRLELLQLASTFEAGNLVAVDAPTFGVAAASFDSWSKKSGVEDRSSRFGSSDDVVAAAEVGCAKGRHVKQEGIMLRLRDPIGSVKYSKQENIFIIAQENN